MIARGARIVAVDRDKAALTRLNDALEPQADLLSIEGDVTDESSVTDFVAHAKQAAGKIDIFFNNAGIEGPVHPIADYPLAA
jgi:3alpha(or 20beta)-hydroxysteroid dehydrogenase